MVLDCFKKTTFLDEVLFSGTVYTNRGVRLNKIAIISNSKTCTIASARIFYLSFFRKHLSPVNDTLLQVWSGKKNKVTVSILCLHIFANFLAVLYSSVEQVSTKSF